MRLPLLTLAGVAAALAGPALGDSGSPPRPEPVPKASRARVPPGPEDFDLEAIRDIFRFGDERSERPSVIGPPDQPEAAPRAPTPAPGARLVGLVRGPDGLRAALALEGEVVLLGAADSALGYTVLAVSEERVVVRSPGGEELTLVVGPS